MRQGARVRLVVAVILGSLLLALGGSEAWALGLTFQIQLGGVTLRNASAYEVFDDSKKPTLKVTLKAVDGGDILNVEVGQQFDSAQVQVLDSSTLAVVATYTLSGVKITAVQMAAESTTPVLTQEIVATGRTLAVTTP